MSLLGRADECALLDDLLADVRRGKSRSLTLRGEAGIGKTALLCVADDAHWLDRASALTLGFVARRLFAEPVGIVFAAREVGEELRPVPELEVHGLCEEDARALLRSAVRFALDGRVRERLIAEAGGNPLALLELPRGFAATELAGGFRLPGGRGRSRRIQDSFARRLTTLTDDARRLVLLAAAEPVGDPLLLWRAAERLGVAPEAAEEAAAHGLLAIGERVRFRHPLARSAVYQSAPLQERRVVRLALAEATDRDIDPDRRAWHLAAAAAGVDEDVALELERSAGRAQARGGLAAAAAFLERAAALMQDPARRVERALAAAQASLQAGAFDAALRLLSAAEAGPIEASQRARAGLLRAEIAFAAQRGGDAPALLLRAAKRIERFDARLARGAHMHALSAALFAARLAGPGAAPRDVAEAVQGAPPPGGSMTVADLLLDGWAALFADGYPAAAPALRNALAQFEHVMTAADQLHLLWLVTITAPTMWDDARWDALSGFHLELARSTGALGELPLALNSRVYLHLFRGELDTADALIDEARVAIEATEAGLTPWGAIALAVLRGREQDAFATLDAAAADAMRRGEGIGLTVIAWARAMLCNGLGMPEQALEAARESAECPTDSAAAAWGTVEWIEAAARTGEPEAARGAARFGEIAKAAGTAWALGVHARSAALVSTGEAAERLYREALSRLARGPMRVDLARAHLLYGEWLHHEQRRAEARAQLRAAHDQFTSIGMEAFAERARKELAATGEKVGKRTCAASGAELTAQQRQIARLARDGLSNPEIGARLFHSPRTVEWHLRRVFTKLGIRSRRELAGALASSGSELAPA